MDNGIWSPSLPVPKKYSVRSVFILRKSVAELGVYHIKKYKKGGEGGVVELADKKEADAARRRKDDFLKVLSYPNMISGR